MKQKTEAFQKVDQFRDAMNKGATKVQAKDLSSTVYLYEANGRPCAVFFTGRARKPADKIRFQSEEKRAEKVSNWMKGVQESKARRAEQSRIPRELDVGDVLKSVWGYDQTNVDYYKVTRLVGKTTVELVQIGSKAEETGWLRGQCIPDPDTEMGERFQRRANGDSVKIDDVKRANKKEPEKLPGGVEVYSSERYSSYH